MSLVGLITGLPALSYILTTEHPLNHVHAWLIIAYMFVILAGEAVYMLRHREELRDPPDQQERRRQWAIQNGPAVLNLFIALFVIETVWLAFQLYSGHLDARRMILFRVLLIAFLPVLVLLVWTKIRMQAKRRQAGHKDSG